MREISERILEIGINESPEDLIPRIERVAEDMSRQGWFFLESHVDGVLENITLLFEKDVGEQ